MDQPATPFHAERIKKAQVALQRGRFEDALAMMQDVLAQDADHQDALYVSAVAARYLEQYKLAQTYLQNLKKASPEYGRAFQEEGHLYRAQNNIGRALAAFTLATRYNPALVASWQGRADLLNQQGRIDEANEAIAQLQRIKALPRELLAVTNHLYEGRILRAEEVVRAFLQKQPHHIEGMRLHADIGSRMQISCLKPRSRSTQRISNYGSLTFRSCVSARNSRPLWRRLRVC